MNEKIHEKHIVDLPSLHGPDDIHLNKYISIPSTVHGYSLAIEFMRDWILSLYPQEFFKTVHIGGNHAYADYRKFNKERLHQIVKPAIAITPNLNTDYNRDNVELIQGGLNIYTRRSPHYNDRFFNDFDSNCFIGIQFRQLEMPFSIKMRVRSRAQQLDLLEYTRIAARIGSTQTHFIDMDCHVPYDIMMALALDMGFEVVKEDDTYKIKDIISFLRYLNSHSLVPFNYKLRTINGKCEFFIRIKDCHVHISCLDGIAIDDGEKQGSTDYNFHIEFTSTLHFSVPAIYSYYSKNEHRIMNKEIGDINALYQIISVKPPEVNERGWGQYLTTQWIEDSNHLDEIGFEELINNNDLKRVIKHNVDIGLSPAMFMDIKLYNGQQDIGIKIDWEHYKIIIKQDVREEVSDIAIYADLGYINDTLANLDHINDSRFTQTS